MSDALWSALITAAGATVIAWLSKRGKQVEVAVLGQTDLEKQRLILQDGQEARWLTRIEHLEQRLDTQDRVHTEELRELKSHYDALVESLRRRIMELETEVLQLRRGQV